MKLFFFFKRQLNYKLGTTEGGFKIFRELKS